MSHEPGLPGDGVREGGRGGSRHIPRDPRDDEGTVASDHGGDGARSETPDRGNGRLPGVRGSIDDATRSSGPAEDQDDESPETRGLTTDTSPSE